MTGGRIVWVKDERVVAEAVPGAMPFRLPPKKRLLPPIGAHVERCRSDDEHYRAWWYRPGTAAKARQHLRRVTAFEAPADVLRYAEENMFSAAAHKALRAMSLVDIRIYDEMVAQIHRDRNETRAPREVIRTRLRAALDRGTNVPGI